MLRFLLHLNISKVISIEQQVCQIIFIYKFQYDVLLFDILLNKSAKHPDTKIITIDFYLS